MATGVLLTSGLVLAGCSGEPDARGPAEVLAEYQEARNADDYEALRALYDVDAVITGHPLNGAGIATVGEVIDHEERRAPWNPGDETWFIDVEVSGDQATFTQIYVNGSFCGATPGDRVTVKDGKITSYTWSEREEPCDPDQLAELVGEEQSA